MYFTAGFIRLSLPDIKGEFSVDSCISGSIQKAGFSFIFRDPAFFLLATVRISPNSIFRDAAALCGKSWYKSVLFSVILHFGCCKIAHKKDFKKPKGSKGQNYDK